MNKLFLESEELSMTDQELERSPLIHHPYVRVEKPTHYFARRWRISFILRSPSRIPKDIDLSPTSAMMRAKCLVAIAEK
jgi:hypothetical protein